MKSYERMELAVNVMKEIARLEGVEATDYFLVMKQVLEELDSGTELGLIEAWFLIYFANLTEGVNLYRDVSGEKLVVDLKYDWNTAEKAFEVRPNGRYSAEEIKFLRIMATTELNVVKRVKTSDEVSGRVFEIARIIGGL